MFLSWRFLVTLILLQSALFSNSSFPQLALFIKKISRRFARSAFGLPRSALEKVPNETFWVISTHCATTRTHWAGFFLVFNHWFSDKKMHFKVPRKPFTTIFQPYSQSFRRAQNILWNCLFKSEFGRFSRRKCRKTIFVKS